MTLLRFRVEDSSQVAEARRKAVAHASALGFDEVEVGTVALAVTEAATNLVKHAQRGEILLGSIARGDAAGMQFYVLDHGPGMADFAASLRDGVSSAGSAGIGLGALSRLSSGFDVYTQRGKGTVMHFEIWPQGRRAAPLDGVDAAALCVAKSGEDVSGDGWLLREAKGRVVLLLVDGLGHGPDAAAAAATARKFVWDHWEEEPAALVDGMHRALKSTRGAAAAVVALNPARHLGTYCGVGNIACSVHAAGARRSLVSHNGTLGHTMRKIQEFSFPFPAGALLVAHSDGIGTRWDLDAYPGLAPRSPGLIAGVLHRDHERGRDDATVVVLRSPTA
ncbi:MAG TPA: ATP-binding SpoIIE family protein phosphatase [Burkholderiales bacterium]|nr:ATP-binding SpoIIE family protein phosphatase [Burkholderiales bacterium]